MRHCKHWFSESFSLKSSFVRFCNDQIEFLQRSEHLNCFPSSRDRSGDMTSNLLENLKVHCDETFTGNLFLVCLGKYKRLRWYLYEWMRLIEQIEAVYLEWCLEVANTASNTLIFRMCEEPTMTEELKARGRTLYPEDLQIYLIHITKRGSKLNRQNYVITRNNFHVERAEGWP